MLKKFALAFPVLSVAALAALPAFAQEGHEAAAAAMAASGITDRGLIALAAALTMAIAAFGGALGQSRAAASALEGMARNPAAAGSLQTAMIIALALIESLVLYGLLIAYGLSGKV